MYKQRSVMKWRLAETIQYLPKVRQVATLQEHGAGTCNQFEVLCSVPYDGDNGAIEAALDGRSTHEYLSIEEILTAAQATANE